MSSVENYISLFPHHLYEILIESCSKYKQNQYSNIPTKKKISSCGKSNLSIEINYPTPQWEKL